MRRLQRIGTALMATTILAGPALAQEQMLSFSSFGTPGLVDTPTALSMPDGAFGVTLSYGASTLQGTITFQMTDRLSGSFRYSEIGNWYPEGLPDRTNPYEDRSFDLRFRVLDETARQPAVTIGLQDLLGTGLYSNEYIVATKHLTPRLQISGGLGWGRMAREDGFDNPLGLFDDSFRERAPLDLSAGLGNEFRIDEWFRGDATVFGGVMWQASERLRLKAEYSPDPQTVEEDRGNINVASPLNFGADYQLTENISAQGWYRHGDQIGATLTMLFNPNEPLFEGGTHGAPVPVRVRGDAAVPQQDWSGNATVTDALRDQLATLLAAEGLRLEAVRFSRNEVTVRVRNQRFEAEAEAIGRTARIMSQALPDSVERFAIVSISEGLVASQITLNRRTLEQTEFAPDGAERLWADAVITNGPRDWQGVSMVPGTYPRFRWTLRPGVSTAVDDLENRTEALPFRLHAEATARYDFTPGLIARARVRQHIAGADFRPELSDRPVPAVRSNNSVYESETGPRIMDLTLSYRARVGEDLYAGISGGLFEPMFGGVATELLWWPATSSIALGGELAWVQQRDFDQRFGFQDYDVMTGHLSAYYRIANEYLIQVDAGRYLAGDWGSTLSVSREFATGWEVKAWATVTDMSAEDFGDGSFDKGIEITIPFAYILGQPTRREISPTFRPFIGDGGARLARDGRLYEDLSDFRQDSFEQSWGRVWR